MLFFQCPRACSSVLLLERSSANRGFSSNHWSLKLGTESVNPHLNPERSTSWSFIKSFSLRSLKLEVRWKKKTRSLLSWCVEWMALTIALYKACSCSQVCSCSQPVHVPPYAFTLMTIICNRPGPSRKARRLAWLYSRGAPWQDIAACTIYTAC